MLKRIGALQNSGAPILVTCDSSSLQCRAYSFGSANTVIVPPSEV
jgi:hypothetical protein